MKKFDIGLKIWSNNLNYIPEILRLKHLGAFNYLEIYALPDTFDATIHEWRKISSPYIVHCPHSDHGMNLADRSSMEKNKRLFASAKRFADTLKSPYLILHPGVNGTIDETISQIKELNDKRILLENKPLIGRNGETCVGSTPDEISKAIKATGCGFCLDIGHAICSANAHKKDPIAYLEQFAALGPSLYHLSDGDINGLKDEHAHIGKGTFPFEAITKLIPSGSKVTIETDKSSTKDLNDFLEDIDQLGRYAEI
jgi:deoxyribonuclease IV